MTTELHFDDPPYRDGAAAFYDESGVAIAAHLEGGRDVALLSEGDPLFYGSFMHLFIRLRERVPGDDRARRLRRSAALGARRRRQ